MGKEIQLKTDGKRKVHDPETGKITEEPYTTRDILQTVLENTPKDYFNLKEYRKRDRIMKILEDDPNATVLKLEDNDFQNLKEWSNEVRWIGFNRFVFEYLEELEKL